MKIYKVLDVIGTMLISTLFVSFLLHTGYELRNEEVKVETEKLLELLEICNENN